jgi:hypothetical protein
VLRKAVEYSRIMRLLEHAEELRLTPMAVERLTADAERLRQEVLRETAEIYRRFREEFFFVKDFLEGHRVVRREVPEVREVVKAFEEAVAEALKAPQRRERVFREVFAERVERLVEEYMQGGETWRLWRGLDAPPGSWPKSPSPWAGGLWRTSQSCCRPSVGPLRRR